MDRLNKGQVREFTAIFHDVFSRNRVDPKNNLSELKIAHLSETVGEVTDLDWVAMNRELEGYYTYILTIDDRFDVGRMYNVFLRGSHPVDGSENMEKEQFIVIDDASIIEGLLMSARTCNVPGGLGYPCR